MTESAIVNGEFVTYSHVKTRKVFTITIEFPEENALHVLNTLGSPIGGNSKPVAIALLDKSIVTKPQINCDNKNHNVTEKITTEGEKLRTRAVMLCRDNQFQQYIADIHYHQKATEQDAIDYIYLFCQIKSRSEIATNKNVQEAFSILLREYGTWKVSNMYADNLSR